MSVHVIPNAGTLVIESGAVQRVLGTLIVDDETAILHVEDGPDVVLADTPAAVASIRVQAGLNA